MEHAIGAVSADTHCNRLRNSGADHVSHGGTAEIVFDSGFGSAWGDVPGDLAQAVLMLAAHFYDNRSAIAERAKPLPLGVKSLLMGHRDVRLFGGIR